MRRYKNGGLGDKVEKAIKSVGLDKLVSDDCGCSERKEKLNELYPSYFYAKCLTEEQVSYWKGFRISRFSKYSNIDITRITDIYNYITESKESYPCITCPGSSSIIVKMKTIIDIVYNEQNKKPSEEG